MGGATGKVLGFTFNGGTAFGETSQGGNRGAYKTLENTLTGLLYVKTSFYHCTNGTTYTLKNTAGNIVFLNSEVQATTREQHCGQPELTTLQAAMGKPR